MSKKHGTADVVGVIIVAKCVCVGLIYVYLGAFMVSKPSLCRWRSYDSSELVSFTVKNANIWKNGSVLALLVQCFLRHSKTWLSNLSVEPPSLQADMWLFILFLIMFVFPVYVSGVSGHDKHLR